MSSPGQAREATLRAAGFDDGEVNAWHQRMQATLAQGGFTPLEQDNYFGVREPELGGWAAVQRQLALPGGGKSFPSMPAATAGHFDAPKPGPPTAMERIITAAGNSTVEGFGDAPIGLTPEQEDALRGAGIINDYGKPATNTTGKYLTEGLIRDAAAVGDTAYRGLGAVFGGAQAAIAQTGQELGNINGDPLDLKLLGRDVAAYIGTPEGVHASHPLPDIAALRPAEGGGDRPATPPEPPPGGSSGPSAPPISAAAVAQHLRGAMMQAYADGTVTSSADFFTRVGGQAAADAAAAHPSGFPDPAEFGTAARVITGGAPGALPAKLRTIYAQTGVRPATVGADAATDPGLRHDLASSDVIVPERYTRAAPPADQPIPVPSQADTAAPQPAEAPQSTAPRTETMPPQPVEGDAGKPIPQSEDVSRETLGVSIKPQAEGAVRRPSDLVKWLARKGGLRADDPEHAGDLRGMGAHEQFVPGAGMLVRKSGGMGLDRAREMATEAGYGPYETTSDLLNGIDNALRGGDEFSQNDMDQVVRWKEQDSGRRAGPAPDAEQAATDQIKELRNRADALGVEHDDTWTAEDLLAGVIEREATREDAEGTQAHLDAAELDLDRYIAKQYPHLTGELARNGYDSDVPFGPEHETPARPTQGSGQHEAAPGGPAGDGNAGAGPGGGRGGTAESGAIPGFEQPANTADWTSNNGGLERATSSDARFKQPPEVGEQLDLADEVAARVADLTQPHSVLAETARYVIERGRATGTESLVAYDVASKSIIDANTVGAASAVKFSPKLSAAINAPEANIVGMHNHPSGRSLSMGDIKVLGYPGMKWIVALGHNGQWYGVRLAVRQELAILSNIVNAADHATRFVIEAAIRDNGLKLEEANETYSHLIAAALDRAGIIDYLTSYVPPTHLASLFRQIVMDAGDALAGIADEDHVPRDTERDYAGYRHAVPVRFQDGMDEILGRDGQTPAGRSGSGRGAQGVLPIEGGSQRSPEQLTLLEDGDVFDWTSPGGGSRTAKIGPTEITYGISKDGTAELTLVRTSKASRNLGSARAAIEQFLREADAHGYRVSLTAEPMEGGVSKPRLEKFYASLGFKQNRGRTRDFSTRAAMLREPGAGGGFNEPPDMPPRGGNLPERSDAEKAVLARIVEQPTRKRSFSLEQLYTDVIDDLNPVKVMERTLAGERPLETKDSPYALMRLFRGTPGRVEQFLERSPFKFDTLENVGKSLKDILRPVRNDLDGLRAYIASRRAVELADRDIVTGIPRAAAEQVIADGDARYAEITQELHDYQRNLLDYLRDSGVLGDEAYRKIIAANEDYVPFYRLMGEDEGRGGPSAKGKVKNPVKTIKGSERQIIDPLESIVRNTDLYIKLAEKNRALTSLVNLAAEHDLGDDFLKRVPTQTAPIKITDAEAATFLKDQGINAENAEGFTVFRPKPFQPSRDEIAIFREGKREVYRVIPELADAVDKMDPESLPWFIKLLAMPSRALRAGATLIPDFIARNVFRDQITANSLSHYGFVPFYDTLRSLGSYFAKDADYQAWLKGGGANGAMVSLDRRYMEDNIFGLARQTGMLDRVVNVIKTPFEMLRIASEIGENATRLGAFKRAMSATGDPYKAAFEAREVTLDFARIGAKMRAINAMVAFSNAGIQGVDRVVRAFKENPLGTTAKTIAAITMPSVLLWFANHDDPRWKGIPQWERDLFWIVMTKDHIYRIPKPFELGILFGTLPEHALDAFYDKKPDAFKGVSDTVLNGLMPNYIPTFALPVFEAFANRSTFTGNKIVPASMEGILPEYQYTNYTTNTAKLLGRFIAIMPGMKQSQFASPIILENYLRAWSGGLGMYALQTSDLALRKAGVIDPPPAPAPTLADTPFIKAFVVRYPSASDQRIQDFYDRYTTSQQALDTISALSRRGEPDAAMRELRVQQASDTLVRLSGLQKGLMNIEKEIRMITIMPNMAPAEKRQMIDGLYYSMIHGAEMGNKMLDQVDAMREGRQVAPTQAGQ